MEYIDDARFKQVIAFLTSDEYNYDVVLRYMRDVVKLRMTPMQMAQLCEYTNLIPGDAVVEVLRHPDFDDQAYLVFMENGTYSDRSKAFDEYRTAEQIKVGLSDRLTIIRRQAYNHPCCTDAMRVEYDLTTKG